jgi:hypothetical protein
MDFWFVTPKRWYTLTRLRGVTNQKTIIHIHAIVKSSMLVRE